MTRRKTQRDVVLAYLLDVGRRGLTQRECYRIGGGTRLAAIVYELREDGYNVLSELLDVENSLGGRSHPARYWLGQPVRGAGTPQPAPGLVGHVDAPPAPWRPVMRQMTLDGHDEDVEP